MDLRDYDEENVFSERAEICCCIFHTQMVAQRVQSLNSTNIGEVLRVFFPAAEEQVRKKARFNNVSL